ncbi:MAG: beta-hexosaminidase, partial [Chitinophagaceae bacterium]
RASHSAGAYYGCMSLLQATVHSSNSNRFVVPAMQIEDHPRFAWRGLMLDCSRTFLSIDFLKRMINRMSFYKLNTLHLHLTDDQGWRLQIKKYPLLTTKGAYFVAWYHEPKEFQGFYTQSQMKELVAYAQKRHITIVPEIECPGHSHAALYAYPELSCEGKVTPVFPAFGEDQKVRAFSPCKKGTYLFYKEVIREVANVFPSPYIHMGGDEVSPDAWKNCTRCKTMADSLGIPDDTKHLQKIIMDSVGKYVSEEGRRPIGWDEVFYEGVQKNYIIQLWRSDESIKEAKAGYDVILSPTTNLYFDYTYKTTPTKKVFSFNPIPDSATTEEKNHYLGIEACFWSHIDRTESKMDYQLFPRVLALSERAWSAKRDTSYNDFHQREIKQEPWLNYFKIVYNKTLF